MVRLLPDWDIQPASDDPSFNPTMVRLLHVPVNFEHQYNACFNPTMVRLLLNRDF